MPDHEPERPSWRCHCCAAPWPCDPARHQLAARMDRIALAVHMWERLDHAVGDLPAGPPTELFERFIRWTH
ncbi:hypothetical protein ACIA5D_13125 [Actinoplanes sp. NPDC051513]|uniref:hypothetical protein n=1 Tax=Actinoplanes sp. NPDC051513 TaxID=3363908 RepID=UPI0037AE27A1